MEKLELEKIAKNDPLNREESIALFMHGIKQRPTCGCLREVETGELSCFHCFVQCTEQSEILHAREQLKKLTT